MRFNSLQCILTNAEVAIVSCVMIVMMSLIQKEPARSVPKRNMKNKITCILPAVIFFLIVLTGCGKRELVSEHDSTPAEESESENVEYEFILKKIIKHFM